MTTIAWDGRTLAADQCGWSGGTRMRVRKLFRIQNPDRGLLLVAFTGTAVYNEIVRRWMEGGARPNPTDYHAREDICSVCAVVVDSAGRVFELSNSLDWLRFDDHIHACGGGREMAFGALEAGASAVRAIEIVARRSDYAGFGVDSETLP